MLPKGMSIGCFICVSSESVRARCCGECLYDQGPVGVGGGELVVACVWMKRSAVSTVLSVDPSDTIRISQPWGGVVVAG